MNRDNSVTALLPHFWIAAGMICVLYFRITSHNKKKQNWIQISVSLLGKITKIKLVIR